MGAARPLLRDTVDAGYGGALIRYDERGEPMAQSQNSTVELTVKATNLMGLTSRGSVMIGNKAFEFYNERNPEDYVQIPWDEIDHVSAEVIAGKHIPRFAIFVKGGAHFTFSTRDNKMVLRAVREHVGEEKLRRSPDFKDVIVAGVKSVPRAVSGLFGHRG